MNPLLHRLNAPEWTHLVAALLHSLWQGVLLAILLAMLLRYLTPPRLRYYAALSTLGVLLLVGLITWAVLATPKPIPLPVADQASPAPATFAAPLDFASPDKVVTLSAAISPAGPTTSWTAWLALTWMLGAFAMLLRAGIKLAGAEKLRRSCRPLKDETMLLLVADAGRAINLARKIRVAVTDQLTSPAVIGLVVPTLILPLSLFTALTPEQIRFVLLHELAHIRRGDYLANLFQLLAEALLFFNPAVWWLSHQIRREREACCDALAIERSGAPAEYARTLVRVAENILPPAPTTALAFGDVGRETSSLADRVQRLLVPGYRPALRLTWRAMLISLCIGGALLFLSAVGTRNTVGALLAAEHAPQNKISSTNGADLTLPGGQKLNAESIVVDAQTGAIVARGNARLETTNEIISGRELWINRNSNIVTGSNSTITLSRPTISSVVHPGRALPRKVTLTPPSAFETDHWAVGSDDPFKSQWFFYRAAAGQRVTNPTGPIIERTFEIDPAKFFRAVQASAHLTATPTWTNLGPYVRPYFAQAGIHLTPEQGKSFYLSSRGTLAIRATKEELDQIKTLLSAMPGIPVFSRTYPIAPDRITKIAASLPSELGAIVATNPAAGFRKVIESFDATDPRPKGVHYLPDRGELIARATAADHQQFSILLQQRPNPAPNLATREYKLPVELVQERILSNPLPVSLRDEAGGQRLKIIHQSLRDWLTNANVELDPGQGKSIFYNDRAGIVWARATPEELDTIESAFRALAWRPPQINLKVRWVELSDPLEILSLAPPSNAVALPIHRANEISGTLNRSQLDTFFSLYRAADKIRLISEGQVTTLTDRQAQIQVTEVKTVVTGIAPHAGTPPGISSPAPTNSDYLRSEPVPLGPVIDLLPAVELDQQHITVRAFATLTEFAGYEPGAPPVQVYVNGQKSETTLPLPRFQVRQLTNSFTIADGETFFFGTRQTTEVRKQPDGTFRETDVTAQRTNHLVVFITATIIDPTGQPISPYRPPGK